MNIGLDLDEVIVDISSQLVKLINKTYGTSHTMEVFQDYNFFVNDYLGTPEGNLDVANSLVKWVNDPEFIARLDPFPCAMDVVNSFIEEGHTVHFITARREHLHESTRQWLLDHDIPHNSLYVIGMDTCKGMIGKTLALDLYVDDYHENVIPMLKKTKAKVFLVNRPWNKIYANKKVTRINKLGEIGRYVEEKEKTIQEGKA